MAFRHSFPEQGIDAVAARCIGSTFVPQPSTTLRRSYLAVDARNRGDLQPNQAVPPILFTDPWEQACQC